MGRQGHSALQKALFGNVTEKVARKARCAVLIIPLDFQKKQVCLSESRPTDRCCHSLGRTGPADETATSCLSNAEDGFLQIHGVEQRMQRIVRKNRKKNIESRYLNM